MFNGTSGAELPESLDPESARPSAPCSRPRRQLLPIEGICETFVIRIWETAKLVLFVFVFSCERPHSVHAHVSMGLWGGGVNNNWARSLHVRGWLNSGRCCDACTSSSGAWRLEGMRSWHVLRATHDRQ